MSEPRRDQEERIPEATSDFCSSKSQQDALAEVLRLKSEIAALDRAIAELGDPGEGEGA